MRLKASCLIQAPALPSSSPTRYKAILCDYGGVLAG